MDVRTKLSILDQIRACKPWVAAELDAVRPRIGVCRGSVAALSWIGSRFRILLEARSD